MDEIFTGKTTLAKAITAGEARIDGNAKALQDVLACLDSFEFWFDIITANPPPKK
jgi:alkyl sulfatase BDS1-like metallo-beta-lactamase superfamily hydrolase